MHELAEVAQMGVSHMFGVHVRGEEQRADRLVKYSDVTVTRAELGPQDRVKVEQYTDAVRDVERRIARAEQQSDLDLPDMAQPQGARTVADRCR